MHNFSVGDQFLFFPRERICDCGSERAKEKRVKLVETGRKLDEI